MEHPRDTEMSITSGLNPNTEESRSGLLTIIEQIIAQVIEKVGGETTFFENALVHTPETDFETELEQLPQTADMSPIIRPIIPPMESVPYVPLSETKISVILDKTLGIILEFLINSAKICLVWEELSQNEENHSSD